MPGLKDWLARRKSQAATSPLDDVPPNDPGQGDVPAAEITLLLSAPPQEPEQSTQQLLNQARLTTTATTTSKPKAGKPVKPEQSPMEKTLEMLRTIEVSYILELLTPRLLIERDQQLKKAESRLTTVNQRIEKLTAQREDVLRTRLDTLNQSF